MNPWQPTLRGPFIRLRPIVAADLDGLHAAASDPLIWEQHSERNRHERAVFERFFKGALECDGGLVIAERDGGRIIGSSRYYDWDQAGSSVVIGYTFLERAHWGGRTNAEVKSLMLAHAFEHVTTAWVHVSPGTLRSQRALERIGARLDRREQVPVGGVLSDRLIYRIDRPG